MDKLVEYWIVKGAVTLTTQEAIECYGVGVKQGDVEWQVSNGPSGQRGSSADFVCLEKALAWACAHGSKRVIINWEG